MEKIERSDQLSPSGRKLPFMNVQFRPEAGVALAFLRRYVPDGGRELCMGYPINWPVFDLGACRIIAKEVVALPVPRWSDGSGNKTTTAVRADVPQNVIDTRRAERAFIGANARFK
jgi:hypothetical protein